MLSRLLRSFLIVSTLLLSLHSISPAQATQPATPAAPTAAGDLDPSFAGFGTNGGPIFGVGVGMSVNSPEEGGMTLAPDGKVVMVGGRGGNALVWRYLPNGQPDPTFNGDGYVEINLSYSFGINDVAIQADGKIVLAGQKFPATYDFVLVRLKSNGDLDTEFGPNGTGYVLTDFYGGIDNVETVLVQPDGKIIAAGSTDANDPGGRDFAVARYTDSGQPDSGFGDAGIVQIDSTYIAYDMALQSDGKLVLVGTIFSAPGLARLNIDGSLDADDAMAGYVGFGEDGIVTANYSGDAYAVAIQPDGNIVVLSNRFSSYVARYDSNGVLDPTFGPGGTDGDGTITIPNDKLYDLALQPGGKMVLLGYNNNASGDDYVFYRLSTDGAFDTTFGYDGGVVVDFNAFMSRGQDLALMPDGRIVGFGWQSANGTDIISLSLVRLWPNGRTFDAGGQQTHAIVTPDGAYPAGSDEYGNALAVQPDGKLLVAGEVRYEDPNPAPPDNSYSDAVVTRFNPNGTVDATFGVLGTARAPWSGQFNGAQATTLQSDGKIVIAGYADTGGASGSTSNDFLIARFTMSGTIDTSFNAPHGHLRVDFANGPDQATALALAPDGKIVVAGYAHNGVRSIWGIARLMTNGTPDTSFGPGQDGKAYVNFTSSNDATAVVVQPDHKVIVAGTYADDFFMQRLLPNGLPDPSFGTQGGYTLTDMGGIDGLNALALAPNGWLYAAGYTLQSNNSNIAIAQYTPNGLLPTCPASLTCDHWPEGKRFVHFTLTDSATALALRSDNQLAVAGCSDGKFIGVQFSTTDSTPNPTPITFSTDFVGTSGECARAVRFVGNNQIILAGSQEYQGDQNIALARFETTTFVPPMPTMYRLFLPLVRR